ncbi:MAG: hypothetical protein DHS20C18_16980 [Saprospiraceae bacterium]|nr:MAG: hypothetical protein DHS20C18_16980 [Saprospiraceae bacterium]
MTRIRYFTFLILLLGSFSLCGQAELGDIAPDEKRIKSVKDFFVKGQLHGHVRNYFMATINEKELKDYWTNATGGAFKYETANWKGVQFGIKGVVIYQTVSSDLSMPDLLVQKSAGWEKELYDIALPPGQKVLTGLDELYIQYSRQNSIIRLGKIDLNQGPLLLNRDGRMKPFVYQGIWVEINELKNHQFNLGWINGVSPRGMTQWYSLNEAIGLLNNGFQQDGTKAEYHQYANTAGMGILGYKVTLSEKLKVQLWDYFLHNIDNTLWVQADLEENHLFGGMQYVLQTASQQQQTLRPENQYFQPQQSSNTVSVQVGYQSLSNDLKLSASYLHGFGPGRFLFPKELGRENFYVSQARSWVDGFGRVNIYMIRGQFQPNHEKWDNWSFDFRFSFIEAPVPQDFAQNKYARSDYGQATLLVDYEFEKQLEGLHLSLLYVLKDSGSQNLLPSEIFYKTNLHHFNLIANIIF